MQTRDYGLREIRQLTPRDFELLIADIWQECQGWKTEVTDPGADGGIDVLGRPPGRQSATAVQAKLYQAGQKLGRPDVQKYGSLPSEYDAIRNVTIITTSAFTDGAKEAAERLNVKLIDGGTLLKIIDEYDAGYIVEWYCEGKPMEGV